MSKTPSVAIATTGGMVIVDFDRHHPSSLFLVMQSIDRITRRVLHEVCGTIGPGRSEISVRPGHFRILVRQGVEPLDDPIKDHQVYVPARLRK